METADSVETLTGAGAKRTQVPEETEIAEGVKATLATAEAAEEMGEEIAAGHEAVETKQSRKTRSGVCLSRHRQMHTRGASTM